MSLPAPELDDRRFQDIVDEAKGRITRHCPEWTAHNVSDPGVAMVELLAWMTELTLYRLNQVPDRLYVKFLELIGVELRQAVPATAGLLFRLTAPRDAVTRVPARTQVSTERRGDEEPVIFRTTEDLEIRPNELTALLLAEQGRYDDRWEDLRRQARSVRLFPGLNVEEAVYVGLAASAAAHLLRLDVQTGPRGAGVVPENPPLAWDAWDGRRWSPVRVIEDTCGGFNMPGQVTLLLPARHEARALAARRAYWVRCRLVEPGPGQTAYSQSPELDSLSVVVLGGVAPAMHAEWMPAEVLGVSDGQPGQVFRVRRTPALPLAPDERLEVQLYDPQGRPAGPAEVGWQQVDDLADATADDSYYTWSGTSGEIRFGPRVLDGDGRVRQHGRIPPAHAEIRLTGYRCGGGRRGNLPPGRLVAMQTSVPYIAGVTNLDPSTGGVDAETLDNAKARGPLWLRSLNRAVTATDIEQLTLRAAPAVARARCLPPVADGEPARLLIVPRVDAQPDALNLDDLTIPPELEERIKSELEPRRMLTMRLRISAPGYQGVKVVADVRAEPGMRVETVRQKAQQALYVFLNPLTGGPGGEGWPFGVDLRLVDVYGVLHGVTGVKAVEAVHFFPADLRTRETLEQADQRLTLRPDALFMSFEHRVVVRH